MLVIAANWSISDGTLVGANGYRPWQTLVAEVPRIAMRAGFRRDGAYRPVEQVDIVVAGDTFDWLLSREWLGPARPWHTSRRAAGIRQRVRDGSLRRGAAALAGVVRLARRGLHVPLANRHFRPVVGSRVRVPVSVTLLAGDRDEALAEAGGREIAERFGVGVGTVWASRGVSIWHGQDFDPLCGPSRTEGGPSLAESLRVDLLARFIATLADCGAAVGQQPWLVAALAQTTPLGMPAILSAWLRFRPEAECCRQRVATLWRRAVEGWHRESRQSAFCADWEFDVAAEVAIWMESAGRTVSHPLQDWLGIDRGSLPTGRTGTLVMGHLPVGCSDLAPGSGRRVCVGPREGSAHAGAQRSEGAGSIALAGGEALLPRLDSPLPGVALFADDECGGLTLAPCGAAVETVPEWDPEALVLRSPQPPREDTIRIVDAA